MRGRKTYCSRRSGSADMQERGVRRAACGLRVRRAVIALAILVLPVRAAFAQTARFAMVISGTSGGEEFAAKYRQWLDAITKVLKEKGGLDQTHLIVLSE